MKTEDKLKEFLQNQFSMQNLFTYSIEKVENISTLQDKIEVKIKLKKSGKVFLFDFLVSNNEYSIVLSSDEICDVYIGSEHIKDIIYIAIINDLE